MGDLKPFLAKVLDNDITDDQLNEVKAYFRTERFKKRTTIFRPGDKNTRHYFVVNGLIRLYLINAEGKEFNVLFAKENQVLGDLVTPQATSFYLAAVEDTTVYSIDEKAMNLLSKLATTLNWNQNQHMRRSYVFIQKRLVSILSKTAEENYVEFRDKNPDLIQRLPQYHVASYLGISPEFLSKVIAKVARK